MSTELDFIKNIDKLVPRPEIALEVLRLAHDGECDFNRLARRIETDPNLTANMLHLANSAYFGQSRTISSVHDIIIRLGLETVKLIAITSASAGLLKDPQEAYNLDSGSLWRHSQATAILSAVIGRHAGIKDQSSLYTAALLHDLGKVVLNRPFKAALYDKGFIGQELNLLELEHSLLQTDHARVGMFLLEKWGLPAEITVPVGFHHQIDKALIHKVKTRIVFVADRLVDGIGFSAEGGDAGTINVDDMVDEKVYQRIPNFIARMETIIDEFFEKMNDATTQIC